jgi:hypothetical protein
LIGVAASITAVMAATKIWTAVQWALNAAMSANPLVKFIVMISAVAAAVIYAYEHFAKFRAVLWGVWETVKEFGRVVGDVFMGVGKVIAGVLTLSPSMVTEGFNQTLDAITNAGNRLGHAFKKGYDDGMADFNASQAKEKKSLIPKKAGGGKAIIGGEPPKEPKIMATGSKTVTINVHIAKLGETHLNVTNLKEGLIKIHDQVISVLTGATND